MQRVVRILCFYPIQRYLHHISYYRLVKLRKTFFQPSTSPEIFPMDRQKRQTPQLPNIALGRTRPRWRWQRAQRDYFKPIVVNPAPHLATELGRVGVDQVPEMRVCGADFVVDNRLCAEVW